MNLQIHFSFLKVSNSICWHKFTLIDTVLTAFSSAFGNSWKAEPSGDRKVVGGVASVLSSVNDFCFEHLGSRRGKNVINLFAAAGSLELIEGSNVHGVWMQHAKRVNHRNGIGGFALSSVDMSGFTVSTYITMLVLFLELVALSVPCSTITNVPLLPRFCRLVELGVLLFTAPCAFDEPFA